jgi:AbrB family looped-hinge helix DNA binding protein
LILLLECSILTWAGKNGYGMRVTSKGQVTIPKHIRQRAGIVPGTNVEFSERNGEVRIRKTPAARARKKKDAVFEDYLEKFRGTLDLGMSTDEYMELLRGE